MRENCTNSYVFSMIYGQNLDVKELTMETGELILPAPALADYGAASKMVADPRIGAQGQMSQEQSTWLCKSFGAEL